MLVELVARPQCIFIWQLNTFKLHVVHVCLIVGPLRLARLVCTLSTVRIDSPNLSVKMIGPFYF